MLDPLLHHIAVRTAKISIKSFRHLRGGGGLLLDLGANIGEVSLALEDQFDKIVAVEAHPLTFEIAVERIKASGSKKIELMCRAVTGKTGEEMFISTPEKSTSSTVRAKKVRVGIDGYYKPVTTISLQDLIEEHHPRVIKMDIEGCEYDALEDVVIPSGLEYLVVEFHGATSKKMFGRLLKCADNLSRQGLGLIDPKSLNSRNGCLKFGFMTFVFQRQDEPVTISDILDIVPPSIKVSQSSVTIEGVSIPRPSTISTVNWIEFWSRSMKVFQ